MNYPDCPASCPDCISVDGWLSTAANGAPFGDPSPVHASPPYPALKARLLPLVMSHCLGNSDGVQPGIQGNEACPQWRDRTGPAEDAGLPST